ncbi:MAG TPA: zinc-dependent metalloprotease [Phycisphaerales bacterium]|nr:zinc-dependent metalloprotease [Phycisphaerales bacterium]
MTSRHIIRRLTLAGLGGTIVLAAVAGQAYSTRPQAANDPPSTQPDAAEIPDAAAIQAMMSARGGARGNQDDDGLRPFDEVSKGYRKVVSTADGSESFYGLWVREKDGQMLAELPRGYDRQRHFIAMTVAGGDIWAGLQAGDRYFYWKRYGNRLAMIEPNYGTRSTGDQESRSSVNRIFTDRVILDIPILANGPSGQPVIDMDDLLVGQASTFFGGQSRGANTRLATIAKSKAFPENIEVAFEMPVQGGILRTFHYSISLIPENTGYKPRQADNRVGFFTTSYRDLGKFDEDEKWVRYVNRWKLEKADPKLRLSPPKEPIVFYVEHTVPVRYRRWVREGALQWNKAFEQVGITGAVEVYYQDKSTGAHMEKDPEDRRYNFLRWLSNDVSTAIGPSRVHPMTGQILDADVVLTDGWIRAFWYQYNKTLPELALEGFAPDALAWLEQNPDWDPRIRMASPAERDHILAQRSRRGVLPYGGHPAALASAGGLVGESEYDGLLGRVSQINGLCMASYGKAMDLTIARVFFDVIGLLDDEPEQEGTRPRRGDLPPEVVEMLKKQLAEGNIPQGLAPEVLAILQEGEPQPEGEPKGEEDKPKEDRPRKEDGDILDGVPEWFVGPMLRELVAHEVGHTLGLRHNFAASSVYSMAEINSEEFKGKKPWSVSVMDYNPANINMGDGPVQGDFAVIDIGPYDMWAIRYGYALDEKSAQEALKESAKREHRYATDEDTWGPDPEARRYDMSSDPLEYAESSVRLAVHLRQKLLDRFVKDGDSWAKARQGYMVTLGMQTRSNSMMANWIGGAFVYRDKKGDPDGRAPIEVVPAERQRQALNFVIENTFRDEAFGLTPEVLQYLTIDKWFDDGGMQALFEDPTWPVHDRVMGIQASTLTMLMNPVTLQRVFDNEFRVPADQDAVTLVELLDTVTEAVWAEVNGTPEQRYTPRQPMVSSLRRNLQREHLERLISLALPGGTSGAAGKPISDLATLTLRRLAQRIDKATAGGGANVDAYTLAHLSDAKARIDKALEAQYIYNARDISRGLGGGGVFFQPAPSDNNGR